MNHRNGVDVLPVGLELNEFEAEKDRDSETLGESGDLQGDLPIQLSEILSRWEELPPDTKDRLREILKSL